MSARKSLNVTKIGRVQHIVANFFGLPVIAIRSAPSRGPEPESWARNVAMALAAELHLGSQRGIAYLFHRKHAAINFAQRRVADREASYPKDRIDLTQLRLRLKETL